MLHNIGSALTLVIAIANISPAYAQAEYDAVPSWASSLARAKQLVAKMTLEEKNNITVGFSNSRTGCSGASGGVPRLNFPGLCLQDSAAGIRNVDFATAFPAGISVGASWNKPLAERRGQLMGAEFKRKGANVALGPVAGPLGRVAQGGRNFEGFAADPHLSGQLAAATVTGLQESVIASVKHFIANEQETNRNPMGSVKSYSSNVNDQDMHELYLWPFQDAVHAGAACVMTSYNRVNQTYASENNATINGLLKGELNFPGFAVTDWGGQHSGIPSALGGSDMAMPTSTFWKGVLSTAVTNGSLPKSRLDDMATRIVAAWYYIKQDDPSFPALGVGIATSLTAPHEIVDARDPSGKADVLQSAIEGHVLVKNTNNVLPLHKPKMLSLYGYDATVPKINYPINTQYGTFAYGLQSTNVTFNDLAIVITTGGLPNAPEAGTEGTLWNGLGSGANSPSYISDPYSAMQQQAYEDGTFLSWDFNSTNPFVNPTSTACIIFINELGSEALDRQGLADAASDELVKNVASKCSNTIVIIHNPAIRLVDAWIENSNVTAVMFAHYAGQDSGRALVQLLFGAVSPSGRLPYTVAKKASDYGELLAAVKPDGKNDTDPQVDFSDPSAIDYRYFLANSIRPRYPFGYGLSYSAFGYSNITASWIGGSAPKSRLPPSPEKKIVGGTASLFTPLARVSMTIKNIGFRKAADVVQLYILFPGETKVFVLRGFAKEDLVAGTSSRVTFDLTRRDLSRWDVVAQQWALPKGSFKIMIGANVEDIRLTGSLER